MLNRIIKNVVTKKDLGMKYVYFHVHTELNMIALLKCQWFPAGATTCKFIAT